MKILVTGFEPFDNSPVNPSAQILERLKKSPQKFYELATVLLPVDYCKAPKEVIHALEEHKPDLTICLGEAARRPVISIERVALNLMDFRVPDNNGNRIQDQPVVKDGPAAYFCTLPVRSIFQTVLKAGFPVELSLSAGTYICNQVLYTVLHYAEKMPQKMLAGFIHVPSLPQQAATRVEMHASMSAETSFQAVSIAIEVAVEESIRMLHQ